jgi:hypothetical protein
MTLFRLTALRLGLLSSYFLVTLLIFLFLTNTGILEMMGLKTLSFSNAGTFLRVTYHFQLAPNGAVRDFSPLEPN